MKLSEKKETPTQAREMKKRKGEKRKKKVQGQGESPEGMGRADQNDMWANIRQELNTLGETLIQNTTIPTGWRNRSGKSTSDW